MQPHLLKQLVGNYMLCVYRGKSVYREYCVYRGYSVYSVYCVYSVMN